MDRERLDEMLWAKLDPFKPLWMHLVETGTVARALLKEGCFVPLRKELERRFHLDEGGALALAGYLAAVHDIGKLHPAFQGSRANPEMREFLQAHHLTSAIDWTGFRHELYGAKRMERIWQERGCFHHCLYPRMASVLRYHHQGKKRSTLSVGDLPAGISEFWEMKQQEMERLLWETFSPPEIADPPSHMSAVCMALLGIVIASDWIASGDAFAACSVHRSLEETRKEAAALAREFLAANQMMHRAEPPEIHTFTDLWPRIPEDGMRPLQQAVEELFRDPSEKPLGLILEAPMGEGKTEAALYAALRLAERWGKEGFYVALPTAATSNQMYLRMNRMLAGLRLHSAKLMHGMAWMQDLDTEDAAFHGEDAEDACLWTAPLRRGLIAPFAVGTIDQAMMAAMRVKYGALRLAGLAQKVLIIDELHSYDAYMGEILEILLRWCRVLHIPVVMLSATLPSEKKNAFAACFQKISSPLETGIYPAVTLLYEKEQNRTSRQIAVQGTHQKMELAVERLPLLEKPKEISDLVCRKLADVGGGCFCVLVNTVKEAQEIYRELRAARPDVPALLFHARFSARRRNEIENACTSLLGAEKSRRPRELVLVATQVAEQSLDLDFDCMISDICPVDLLLQRAGRLWRHAGTSRPGQLDGPRLSVLVPENDDYGMSGIVYPELLLKRTLQLLEGMERIYLPQDIPELVERVYHGYQLEASEMEAFLAYQVGNAQERAEASIQKLPRPQSKDFYLYSEASGSFGLFCSDEDTQFLPAQTRLGEKSVRLAILPQELFRAVQAEERPRKALAAKVLLESVTVAERNAEPFFGKACSLGSPFRGTGLLRGIWILPGEEGVCEFEDGSRIVMDRELGLLMMDGDGA